MISVIMSSQYIAAQSKATIASFLGRADWWHQAMHALNESLAESNISHGEFTEINAENNFISHSDIINFLSRVNK